MNWYSLESVVKSFRDIMIELLEFLRKWLSFRRPPRPQNQRLRILLLDRRRKTYHCRNACAADGWQANSVYCANRPNLDGWLFYARARLASDAPSGAAVRFRPRTRLEKSPRSVAAFSKLKGAKRCAPKRRRVLLCPSQENS